MSRKEFMEQLEKLLTDIPQEEKEEALAYYNGYFEDAGIENEVNIIRELESPEKVAGIIKADIGVEEEKEYTETGYEDARFHQQEEVVKHTGAKQEDTQYHQAETHTQSDYANAYESAGKKDDRTLKIALIILAAVVTCPIWIGALAGIVGGIFGILGGFLGILIAAAAVVFTLYVVGFVLAGVGISMFVTANFAAGLGLIGAGLLVLALAVLGTVACVLLYGRFLPWLVKGIIGLFNRLFHRKERAA